MKSLRLRGSVAAGAILVGLACLPATMIASENVPHDSFGTWADPPGKGQLEVGLHYQESEAYYFWDADRRYQSDYHMNGEHYGIDINQGYLSFQYGLTERWTLDLAVGYTTLGWRYFSNFSTNGASQSTSGLMDTAVGVRYEIWRENLEQRDWKPSLSFRAGGVLPGTFDEQFPFAPGLSSAAIEPEIVARKHFGWTGLGAYFDGLFRWNKTSANDQYIIALGLFQKIKGWELHAGWRHLQSISGDDIQFDPATRYIEYPRAPREINDSIEAGFTYTTSKRHIRYEFYSRTVFDGANTDKKFWVGGAVSVPFQLFKSGDS